jgi:hypothetical protein
MAEEEKGTLTLKLSTVKELKKIKRGATWDELLLRLARRQRCSIECVICGTLIETTDTHVSPSVLAEINGWQPLYSGRVDEESGEVKTTVELGYICQACGERQ